MSSFIEEVFEILIKYFLKEGILNEIDLRNIKIRQDFKKLLNDGIPTEKAIKIVSKKSRFILNDKECFLSIKTIQRITRQIKLPSSPHNITNS